MTRDEIVRAADRARTWAVLHVPDRYYYSSAGTWVGSAYHAGIITRDEYDAIMDDYGDLFWYTGD